MAYQAGLWCYEAVADAAAVACANTMPHATSEGGYVTTTSCIGTTSGGLMRIQAARSAVGSPLLVTYTEHQHAVGFGTCQQPDWVATGEVVIAGALGLWAIVWGGKKLLQMIEWGAGWRGDS